VSESLLDRVLCVVCAAPFDLGPPAPPELACARCGEGYSRVGAIPVLLPRSAAHVELWRRQLRLLLESGSTTGAALEEAAAAPGLLPAGAARLAAMARAVRAQAEDFAALLGPALGGPLDGPVGGLPRGVVEYSYYLFRDWGWTGRDARENVEALEALLAVAPGPLGRVLVVGAGGCRLASDLHRHAGATETAVVDIDPYLLVVAEAVVRGRSVRLTEASLNVLDSTRVSTSWTLRAPEGALDDGRFHFFLANGLAPPFADATFDTVVTPWFIDRVPTDLPAFLATVRRLLRPGGRWLNQGPLLYPPETPLDRRYARDEVLELATRAGFHVDAGAADAASRPYLVSPLTGAGKIERVLTFSARRGPD
jgi:SAM-dependent methyltransferase